MFFTVSENPKIHHGGASWGRLDHVGPSWDLLGATLKHLVGFENDDFAWEVLKQLLCLLSFGGVRPTCEQDLPKTAPR